jgi:hypothetical protein
VDEFLIILLKFGIILFTGIVYLQMLEEWLLEIYEKK